MMSDTKTKIKKIETAFINTSDAPLYKSTEKLLYQVDTILNFLSKDRKHTYGQKMLEIVLTLLDCVSSAYDFPKTREEKLELYLSKLNNLATLLKLCNDKGYLKFSNNKNLYIECIQPLGNSKKQAIGWLIATNNNNNKNS